jgi:putative SbcD/Mre11-related phosphoesterase
MIVADLHIGWEMALSNKGIYVLTQTSKLLSRLTSLILEYKPEKLLVLGDVKHTVAKTEMREWQDVPKFFSELKKQVPEICVIRGNHDGNLEPLLPEGVEILPSTGAIVGDVGFFHGHQWLSPTLLKCKTLVMGHVHPVVALRDSSGFRMIRQVWVRADCNGEKLAASLLQKHKIKIKADATTAFRKRYKIMPKFSKLFIMPSFNDFLGGRPLNETKSRYARSKMIIGPVLRSEAVDMKQAELYLLDGTFLGFLSQLENLS